MLVSTHSRLKAADAHIQHGVVVVAVSTHSRLKAAVQTGYTSAIGKVVSTHSRLKAAEVRLYVYLPIAGFNTQPPEGGCLNL